VNPDGVAQIANGLMSLIWVGDHAVAAPSQHASLEGQEHGQTIPLAAIVV
jgi:hypothetical protein